MRHKLLITLAGLLWSTLSFAQWMPDSTVQVVAYWQKGDKMQYDVKAKTVRTDKDGVETTTKSSSERRIFEVIDQTDDSYILQTSYKDVFNSELSLNMGISAAIVNALSEATVLLTKTNENGSILGIVNADEFRESFDKIIELAVDASLSKYDKKDLKELGLTKEELVNNYKQMFSGDEILTSTCLTDVAPLLQFHGGRYDINEEYSTKQNLDNVFGASVESDLSFWVDTEDSDSTFVVFRTYMEISPEQMTPYLIEASVNALKQTLSGADLNDAEKVLKEQYESSHISASLKQYTTTIIHVDTGWTTNWYYDREITISSDEGVESIVNETQEIEIVFDDEDE